MALKGTIPPGHAMIDSGCTYALMGEKTLVQNLAALQKASERLLGRVLKPVKLPSNMVFTGISGPVAALCALKFPVAIAGVHGTMEVHILPGEAPWLASVTALHGWLGIQRNDKT